MKRCSWCGVTKPRADFYKDKSTSDGLKYICRVCEAGAQRKNRRARKRRDPWDYLLKQKKTDARKRNTPFSLTLEWLKENAGTHCPYTGQAWVFTSKGRGNPHADAPQFDQIRAGEGYTPENTQIISAFANRAKGDLSDAEFRTYCLMVEETIGGKW